LNPLHISNNSKRSNLTSKTNTPSQPSTPSGFQNTSERIFKLLDFQEKYVGAIMDCIKRRQKLTFSLKELSKGIRELNKLVKI